MSAQITDPNNPTKKSDNPYLDVVRNALGSNSGTNPPLKSKPKGIASSKAEISLFDVYAGNNNKSQAEISKPKDEDSFLTNFGEGLEQGGKSLLGGGVYVAGEVLDWFMPNGDSSGDVIKEWANDFVASSPEGDDSVGQFLGSLIPSIIPTAVAVGSAPFTGGGSLVPMLAAGSLGVSATGSGMMEYENYQKSQGRPVDQSAKFFVGLAYGVAEYGSERIGLQYLMPKGTGKVLLKGSIERAENAGKKILAQYAQQQPKKARQLINKFLVAGNVEGLEEVVTEIAQEITDKTYKDSKDQATFDQFAKNVVKAYAGGALMGAAIGPLSFASENAVHNQRRKEQGFVYIAKDTKSGEAVEILNKEGDGFNVLTASGSVKKVEASDLSETIDLNYDQFKTLLKDKYDADQMQTEVEAAKQVEQLDQEMAYTNAVIEKYGKKDSEGQTVLETATYEGNPVVVGQEVSGSSGVVYIFSGETGNAITVDRQKLEDVNIDRVDDLIVQHEADKQSVIDNLNSPIQRGEELNIEGNKAIVVGISTDNQVVNIEVQDGDSAELLEMPMDLVQNFRVQKTEVKDDSNVESLDSIVDDEGNLKEPSVGATEEIVEPVNTRSITIKDKSFEIQEFKDKFQVNTNALTKEEADKIAKSINSKYSKVQFEVIDNSDSDDMFAEPDFRVVMNKGQKSKSNEKSKEDTPEKGKADREANLDDQKRDSNNDSEKEVNNEKDSIESGKEGDQQSLESTQKEDSSTKVKSDEKPLELTTLQDSNQISVKEIKEYIGGNLVNKKNLKSQKITDVSIEGDSVKLNLDIYPNEKIFSLKEVKDIIDLKNESWDIKISKEQSPKERVVDQDEQKESSDKSSDKKSDQKTKKIVKKRRIAKQEVDQDRSIKVGEKLQDRQSENDSSNEEGAKSSDKSSQRSEGKSSEDDTRKRLTRALGIADSEAIASILFSPYTPKRRKTVQGLVNQITKGWKNAPEIMVYESLLDFAIVNPQLAGKFENGSEIAGFFNTNDNTINIIASHPENATYANVQRTIYHETFGHYGFRGLIDLLSKQDKVEFNDKLNTILDDIIKSKSSDPAFNRLALLYEGKAFDQLDTNKQRIIAEEYLAHEAEKGVSSSFMDEVISFFRDLYRALTGKYVKFNDSDIRTIIGNSRKFVKTGTGYSPKTDTIRYKLSLFHGGANDMTGFDSDFIGTGAKVNKFGWGHYFTTKEGIAKTYANIASKPKVKIKDDAPSSLSTGLTKEEVKKAMTEYGGKEELLYHIEGLKSFIGSPKIEISGVSKKIKKEALLDYVKNHTQQEKYLYKAIIHGDRQPGEYEFLDWEGKPSDKQRGQLLRLLDERGLKGKYIYTTVDNATTGEEIYKELQSHYGGVDKLASLFMLEAGIDGNKYLSDGMFRVDVKSNDTYNYVVFDDNVIEIEEKVMFKRAPKEVIRLFGNELENLGISDFSYSDSETSFGKSSYLTVGPFKVRASDHSVTSPSRILEEIHLHPITWIDSLEQIERYFFPERYKEQTSLEYGDYFDFPKDKLSEEKFEYKIYKDPSFITKKGRVMVEMQRRNVKKTTWNRISTDIHFKRVTESPEFKKWFGDSKVVDENGEPLVVYHGTKSDFDEFDINKFGGTDTGLTGKGFYFTSNPEDADRYAMSEVFGVGDYPNIKPVYLSIRNPFKIKAGILPDGRKVGEMHGGPITTRKGGEAIRKMADDSSNDGMIWYKHNGQVGHAVAFSPSQIKSAIGNNGQFDSNNPDIRFKRSEATKGGHQQLLFKIVDNEENTNFTNDENDKSNQKQISERAHQESIRKTFQDAYDAIRRGTATTGEKQQGLDAEKFSTLQYAKDNKLWIKDLYELGNPFKGGGVENTLAYNEQQNSIYKSNNLSLNENSVLQLLNSIQGHNAVFPETSYELVGFTGLDNGTKRTPLIEVVLKQKYISDARQATIEEIDNHMENSGFTKLEDYTFEKDNIIIGDLRPRNVLVSDDIIYVVDAVIDIDNKALGTDSSDIRFRRTEIQPQTGFYSNSLAAVDKIPMNIATADQWKAMLLKNGANAIELDWIGFDEFLRENKKPTKDQVARFIRENQVEIEEVVLSEGNENRDLKMVKVEPFVYNVVDGNGNIIAEEVSESRAGDIIDGAWEGDNSKYKQYTLPGGHNYKEVLLTMPLKTNSVVEDINAHANGKVFKSGHWDQTDILAHIRMNERTDAEGNSVLFIEEIQSDWAQEGRKKGFKTKWTKEQLKPISQNDAKERFGQDSADRFYLIEAFDENGNQEQVFQILKSKYETIDDAVNYVLKDKDRSSNNAVPQMPFKKTDQWINLTVKRMIRYASEKGFDKIAWVNGQQSADRYDLSKQIESITYSPYTNDIFPGVIRAYPKKPEHAPIVKNVENEQELGAVIGKEITNKIINGERDLKNIDLKVGGEGMINFYDKMVPNTVSKLLKKLDNSVQVGPVEFNNFEKWYQEKRADSDPTLEDMQKLSDKEKIPYQEAYVDDLKANKKIDKQLGFEISPLLAQTSMQEGMPLFKRVPRMEESKHQYTQRIDGTLRNWQDKFIDLKRLQDGKVKEGGLLEDKMNAYEQENLSKGKIVEQNREFQKRYVDPLTKHIKGIHKSDGVGLDEVQSYLKAKHSLERNAQMFEKKPNGGKSQSGMDDAKANEIIETFENKINEKSLNELHKLVKDINVFILEKNLESGLISEKQFDAYMNQYEYYVPLRGWADAPHDPTYFAPVNIAAKGRTSEAGDPLPYLLAQAQDAITRGEQNKVKQALLEFIKANPDPNVYEIKNSWFVNTGEVDKDGNEVWQETPIKPSKELFDQGLVKRRLDGDNIAPVYSKFVEESVTAMLNGQRVSMIFKKPLVARAFKNADTDSVPKLLGYIRTYTRTLGSLYTQYSPEFSIRNFLRDMTTGMVNIRNDFGNKVMTEILSTVPKSINAVKNGVIKDKYDGVDGQLFKDFVDNGGLTGYSDLKDVSTLQNQLKAEIENIRGGNPLQYTKEMFMKTLKPLDQLNRIFENTIRFASYRYLVTKKGYSPQKAAIYAKDLTVNFNRNGNYSGFMGSLFLFFNASVQGSERLLRPFGVLGGKLDKKVRNRAIATAVMLPAISMMLSMVNRIIGGEDDDGEYYYDKLNDYTRQHNLIIPNLISDKNGDFFQLPLPYGFNVLFASGDHLTRLMIGKESVGEASLNTLAVLMESFSPLGAPDLTTDDADFFENMVRLGTPTALSPAIDLMINKNFAGYPIYKEPFMSGETPRPDSQMHFNNVNPILKAFAQYVNKATGGDSETPGAVDINPETMEHILDTVGGGLGKFVVNSVYTGITIAEGENPFSDENIIKVPFVHSYIKNPSVVGNQQRFFENTDLIKQKEDVYERYIKSKNRKRALEYRKENIEFFRMAPLVERYKKSIKELNNKRRVLEQMDKTTLVKQRIDAIDKQENALYLRFNKEMNNRKSSLKTVKLSEIF